MAKGGARIRSGPTKDPNALRRDRDKLAQDGWVELPAAGRDGPTPEFPLARPTKRELELWDEEWRRPQAIMWEKQGQELEVALYVRAVRRVESPNAPATLFSNVRQYMDNLGISAPGLLRLHWRIVDTPAGQVKRPRPIRGAAERLQVIQGGSA